MILTLALIVLTAVCTLLIFRKKSGPTTESVRSVIMDGIMNVSEFSESKKIPGTNVNIPGTTRKFMLKYNGTIVCGCDLTKVKVSEGGTDRVKITLPRSEILDVYADFNSLEVYDQSAGFFTRVQLEDQNRQITADLEQVKANEIQNGILELADGNVKHILESVVVPKGMLADIVFAEDPEKLTSSTSPLTIPAKLSDE